MSVYHLHGSNSGPGDDVASLDVQFDGVIVAWNAWVHSGAMGTDGDIVGFEASFLSSSMFDSNDARGVIAQGESKMTLNAAGQSENGIVQSLSGIAIRVSAGERIHLHLQGNSGNTIEGAVTLYVEDSADPGLRRRR